MFLLLYWGYSEVNVKGFLKALHILWTRLAMNPLYTRDEPIVNSAFDSRVLNLFKTHLG